MKITNIELDKLNAYENNAKNHPDYQINQIVASIKKFGFTNPILVDKNNEVIAGHGRLEAAKRIELKSVPCIILNDLTEKQKIAYAIADNKIALNTNFNYDVLEKELLKLEREDLEVTGFSFDELETLVGDLALEEYDAGDYSYVSSNESYGGSVRSGDDYVVYEIIVKKENKDKIIDTLELIRKEGNLETISDAFLVLIDYYNKIATVKN